MAKRLTSITDLTPDPANANRGTKRGRDLLERSLERLGAGRSIVVDRHGVIIAGNKTFAEAGALGFDIQVVKSDGRKLIVVQREDLDMAAPNDPRARELAIADNRVAQVDLAWDAEALLNAPGVDLSEYFFDEELAEIWNREQALGDPDATPEERRGGRGKEHECPACGHQW